MTTYPLPTLAATVGLTGISIPNFNDVLLSLIASYTNIYGSDVVLTPDTQDYQWLAIIAAAINDCNQATVAAYNQFSPATSQGVGLSSVVKINNLQREGASASSVPVTVNGAPGTIILNGLIGDNLGQGTEWTLPATVVIPPGGIVTVTATCEVLGAITAAIGTLTVILTPTAGWFSVSNTVAAAPGVTAETDAALRVRQSSSTQGATTTVLGGIVGNLRNLPGVETLAAYENDTNTTDSNGLPPKSICLSVLGGSVQSIVNVLGLQKTIGCATYGGGVGAVSGTYVDPISGLSSTINFNVPTQITILVTITIVPLTGYTTTIGNEIIAAVVTAINSLGIGQVVRYTRLFAPALLVGPFAQPQSAVDPSTYELTSILIAASPGTPAASDVTIAFNQLAVCATTNVTLIT